MVRLPWPPTVNTYYRSVKGRNILSKKAREYKKAVGAEILVQKPERHKGQVCITIHAHPPDKRKRDLDNLLKPILDTLNGSMIEDDSLIEDLRICRFPPVKGGMVKVFVSSYKESWR